jgi:hypothetical protein
MPRSSSHRAHVGDDEGFDFEDSEVLVPSRVLETAAGSLL